MPAPKTRKGKRQPTRRAATPPTSGGTKRSAAAAGLDEEAALQLDEEAAHPARRSRREGAGAHLQQLLAEEVGAEDLVAAAPVRATPRRAAAAGAAAAAAAAVALQRPMSGRQLERLFDLAEAAEAIETEAVVEAVEAPTAGSSPPALQLPAHLVAVRAEVREQRRKSARRVAKARSSTGVVKVFNVGDAVLLLPPKGGRVGSTIDRKRLVCRVVAVTNGFGLARYRLRCNAGVLEKTHAAASLEKANERLAAELRFDGVEWRGMKTIKPKAALAAQQNGAATVDCRCRGPCGKNCACKKARVLCSRNCGCKACKGANCGNY